MRNRTSRTRIRTIEVIVPVVIAALLGLGAIAYLLPDFGSAGRADVGTIRIYSSVPMNRFASIVHGAQMAFDEVDYRAGNFTIDFVPLNGAPRIDGSWTTDVELANARRAAEDPDAMLYIGTYNSGAAKISIPVLNRVNLAMISPGNTYPGLTKPGTGTAGEPWVYYPLGVRNYFRVITADDYQGRAAAAYAREIGATSVYVLDDTELYGHGIAEIFARSAVELGLRVVGGPESIDVRRDEYSDLAAKIMQTGPDLVYFGGYSTNHAPQVLRDLQAQGYTGAFMGADGIADDEFIKRDQEYGLQAKSQIYATLPGLPAATLAGPGADWYSRYKAQYPDDINEDFAPFGYEAARVAISAIERAGTKDREAIRAAVARTNTSLLKGSNILGDWGFDTNGDTSLVTVSVLRPQDRWVYSGLMSYDPDAKSWSFQGE